MTHTFYNQICLQQFIQQWILLLLTHQPSIRLATTPTSCMLCATCDKTLTWQSGLSFLFMLSVWAAPTCIFQNRKQMNISWTINKKTNSANIMKAVGLCGFTVCVVSSGWMHVWGSKSCFCLTTAQGLMCNLCQSPRPLTNQRAACHHRNQR